MKARGASRPQPSGGPAVKGDPAQFRGAAGDQDADTGARVATGRDVLADGAEVGPDDLDRLPQTGAHGMRYGGAGESAKHAVVERLEGRLQKLAQLRGTEAQVLRAIAADLPELLDVLARSSPDADVETTPAMATANAPAREQMLDVNALAALVGVAPKTIRRWRDEGVLPPAIEIAGVIRWRRETIEAWLAEREEQAR